MNSPRLALLIFDSDSLKEEEKLKFLTKIDDSLDEKAIVIIDSNYPKTEFKNLKLESPLISPAISTAMG